MTTLAPFLRRLLAYRVRLGIALACAVFAAVGLGAGFASLVPILRLMLEGDRGVSLATLAADYNAGGPLVAIPHGLAARLPDDPLRGIVLIVAGISILTVLGAAATFVHRWLTAVVATAAIARIRAEAFHHVLALPLVRVVERGPSEFVARIVRDAAELHRGFLALTSKSVIQLTRGMACLVVAVVVSWEVALAAPVAAVVVGVILRRTGKRIRQGTDGSLAAQEDLLRIATESVQGLRTVKASTAEADAARRFHGANRRSVREELRARAARALASPVLEALATILGGAIALLFADRILRGGMTFDQFVVALGALGAAGASFKPLAGIVAEIQAAAAPARRLREILDEPREDAVRRRTLPRHARSIEWDDVVLRYPGADRDALAGATLRIGHGERVALVGPNGSGKTSLVALLPRLVRPRSGRVRIDGVDVESVSLRSLRRQIAVVAQETVLFRGTIAANIALGVPGADRSAVEAAARAARADAFIARLPGGYDADVAEQGASLSGGERQRLALARAILRDPAILILDEATSQIDPAERPLIQAALADFARGRTVIRVTHDEAGIADDERVVRMADGRVVEDGTAVRESR